jgi:hypothetical protein
MTTRSRTPDRSGGEPAANRLSYGAAIDDCSYVCEIEIKRINNPNGVFSGVTRTDQKWSSTPNIVHLVLEVVFELKHATLYWIYDRIGLAHATS